MKRLLALILALSIASICSGCLTADSPEHFGYVLAIGFDRGEKLPYSISFLVQKTKTDSESQNNSGFLLVKAECRTLLEAAETLSGSLPLEINFARAALIVVELSLLTSPGSITELLDVPVSRLRIRYNALVLASVSPAYDTLEGLSNELDPNIGRICVNMDAYSDRTGYIPLTNLSSLFEAMEGELFDAMLPLTGVVKENRTQLPSRDSVGTREYAYIGGDLNVESTMKTSLAGAALLQGDRMVGFLDGQNVQLAMMATGDFQQGRRRIHDGKGQIMTVFLRANARPKIQFSLHPTPKASVTIPLFAYIESPKEPGLSEPLAIEAIEKALTSDMAALFDCCKALRCDTLGFGKQAVRCFHTASDWEAYRWKNAYVNLDAQFSFKITLLHAIGKSELE